MKNKYLLITNETEFSQYIVEAENWQKALSKCYEYYGETRCVTIADFETIIEKKSYEEALDILGLLIDADIMFFGIIQQILISSLDEIDDVNKMKLD